MLGFAFSSCFILRNRVLFANSFVIRSVKRTDQPYPGFYGVCKMSVSPSLPRSSDSLRNAFVTRDSSGIPVLHMKGISKRQTPLWLILGIAAVVIWIIRRIRMIMALSRRYVRKNLNQDIANFYDTRSASWESVWGEHMHHGLYDFVNNKRLRGQPAQVRTMSELLKLGNLTDSQLPPGSKLLDVGCGIGGASRFLARHFGETCTVTGITLSSYQAKRAEELNEEKGLSGRVKNEVRDVLTTGFADESFDLVWSMESGEHVQNKHLFIGECARMLKPDGNLLMLVWCVRESTPPFNVSERYSIRRIMEEYCLPSLSSASEYRTEMIRSGMRDIQTEDWTQRAAPFWGEVLRNAFFNPLGWKALAKGGRPLLGSALAMRHVVSGIKQGVFRLVAFTARKATIEEIEMEAQRIGRLHCNTSSTLSSPS